MLGDFGFGLVFPVISFLTLRTYNTGGIYRSLLRTVLVAGRVHSGLDLGRDWNSIHMNLGAVIFSIITGGAHGL